ncbi:hypothetical protein NXF25_009716 [Crotalus adamanteus]|uniref:Uncharacterized protein n=1 Tax=Crotalus adamanteus TaxID=8729 RepID=A0AAW1BRY2_CROAD
MKKGGKGEGGREGRRKEGNQLNLDFKLFLSLFVSPREMRRNQDLNPMTEDNASIISSISSPPHYSRKKQNPYLIISVMMFN